MYAHHHYGYQEPAQYGSYYPPQAPLLPPPAPVYHPEITFKSDYAARLADLTANSRPIIQSLTVIAQDYTQYADIVAECIEAHIRRVSHRTIVIFTGRIFWPAQCKLYVVLYFSRRTS